MQVLSASWLVAAVTSCLAFAAQAAPVNCTFDLETSKDGLRKLGEHAYRVRQEGVREVLEQRYADGIWYSLGSVGYLVGGDFAVYMHLPEAGEQGEAVRVLTVYRNGNAALTQHNGSWGNLEIQYQSAWTLHGKCQLAG